jgi:hypothetical protein
MGSITSKQWFQIISGIIGSLITAAALLQTLFGQDLTIKIVAVLGIANIVLSSVGAVLSGPDNQQTQIRNVLAMPGVEKLEVNDKASQTLASMAVNPVIDKIGPTAATEAKVTQIAKGN